MNYEAVASMLPVNPERHEVASALLAMATTACDEASEGLIERCQGEHFSLGASLLAVVAKLHGVEEIEQVLDSVNGCRDCQAANRVAILCVPPALEVERAEALAISRYRGSRPQPSRQVHS